MILSSLCRRRIEGIADRAALRWPLWIALVTIVPRVLFLIVSPTRSVSGNAEDMLSIAGNLANGSGYLDHFGQPDGYFNPAYPLLLAGCRLMFGESVLPVKILQIGFDVITALATCALAFTAMPAASVFLLALAMALHPLLLHYANNVNQEPMLVCFTALSLITFYQANESRKLSRFVLAGLVIGVAVLTKTTGVFLPFVLGFVFWVRNRKDSRRARGIAAYLLVYLLALTPWSYRNLVCFGTFGPGVGGFGTAFWWGSDPEIFATYGKVQRQNADAIEQREMEARGVWPQARRDLVGRERVRLSIGLVNYRHLLSKPWDLTRVLLLKCSRSLYATEDRPSAHMLLILIQLPALAACIAGLRKLRLSSDTRALSLVLLVYVVYFYLMVSAAMPMVRYFVPALPFVLFAAAASLPFATIDHGRASSQRPQVLPHLGV